MASHSLSPRGHHGVHRHRLYVPGRSVVHRLRPQAKLAGLLAFVVLVAVTPRRSVEVFAVDAVVLGVVIRAARLPVRTVLGRLLVVLPFIAFAVSIPFIGDGERTEVLGFSLSTDGLWASWNITVKAVLGATASIVVAATTPVPALVDGLARLRVPVVLVSIIAFAVRYLDLLADQLRCMRSAMTARCHDPRWLWQARPIASSAGVLFVRSYERGERVHRAMLARGFTGVMPQLHDRRAPIRDWAIAAVPAMLALAAMIVGLVRS